MKITLMKRNSNSISSNSNNSSSRNSSSSNSNSSSKSSGEGLATFWGTPMLLHYLLSPAPLTHAPLARLWLYTTYHIAYTIHHIIYWGAWQNRSRPEQFSASIAQAGSTSSGRMVTMLAETMLRDLLGWLRLGWLKIHLITSS